MKQFLTSKNFIVGTLAVLCVGILVVCFIVSNDKKEDFVPDPTPSVNPIDSWEASTPSSPAGGATEGNGANDAEQYPKVVEETEDEVVIDFTDPSPAKVDPPETPGTDKDHVDHGAVPIQTPSEGGKPQENPKPNTPAPGSTNDKGQVYDPVFGWVTPSKGGTVPMDNDGDPNKMVGEMD